MAAENKTPAVNIIKLVQKEQFDRWLDSVATAASILRIPKVISDDTIIEDKLDPKVEAQYHSLKLAMLNSLSERLYKIARGSGELQLVIPHTIIHRLKALFKPQFMLNDLRCRKKLYRLELSDFSNITDFETEIRAVANEITQIEEAKKAKKLPYSLINDRDLLAVLIGGLGDKFETQIEFIERDDQATFESVCELLRGKEQKDLKTDTSSSGTPSSINNLGTKRKCSECKRDLSAKANPKFKHCDKCHAKYIEKRRLGNKERGKEKEKEKEKSSNKPPHPDAYSAFISYCHDVAASNPTGMVNPYAAAPANPYAAPPLGPFGMSHLFSLDFVDVSTNSERENDQIPIWSIFENPNVGSSIFGDVFSDSEPRYVSPADLQPSEISTLLSQFTATDPDSLSPLSQLTATEHRKTPPSSPAISLNSGEIQKLQQSAVANQKQTERIVADSGCGRHVTGDKEKLRNIRTSINAVTVNLPDKRQYTSNTIGDIDMWVTTDAGPALIELQEVLLLPNIDKTLVSIKRLAREGYKFIFEKNINVTTPFGHSFNIPQRQEDDIYYFHTTKPINNFSLAKPAQIELYRLHLALGHPSFPDLLTTIKGLGIKNLMGKQLRNPNIICSVCRVTKTMANSVPSISQSTIVTTPFSHMHFDNLVGLTRTPGGKTGYSFAIDRDTYYIHVKLIASKSESKDHIKEMHRMASSFGRQLKVVMSDSAPELFVDKELRKWLNENHTRSEASAPYAQYQNGFCETHVRIIMYMALSALLTSKLPKQFWGEALLWAVDTWNRTLKPNLNMSSPLQKITGHNPDISLLHPFGCECYVRIPMELQKKFEPKAIRCILLGYDMERKAYRTYSTDTKKVIVRSPRDVKFNDFQFPGSEKSTILISHPQINFEPMNDRKLTEIQFDPAQPPVINPPGTPPIIIRPEPNISPEVRGDGTSWIDKVQQHLTSGTRSGKNFHSNYFEANFMEENLQVEINAQDQGALQHLSENTEWVPKSIDQAMKNPEFAQATKSEIDMVKYMKTYHLVPPSDVPSGIKVFQPVMTWKRKFDGSAKARICYPGHKQTQGVDYFLTDSPTAHLATFRAVLAKAQKRGAKMHHIDVKNAFLHGRVQEEVYMKQLKHFEDPEHPDWICKLDGSLYGLKQASRIFYQLTVKYFTEFGLKKNPHDPCHFFMERDENTWIDVAIFVDDYAPTGSESQLSSFTKFIATKFQVKIMGELTRYVGINVKKKGDGSYHLDQVEDIRTALKRYGFEHAKPANTPFDPSWTSIEEEGTPVNQAEYRSAVGSLFWFAMATRPDILSSVVLCSQFQAAPTKQCWTAVKRIFRYLKHTTSLPLVIDVGEDFKIFSYSDSSHGDPLLGRFSMTGSVHFIGNAPILWLSRKQRTPALSSSEAELIAASTTARDTLWLLHLLAPFGISAPADLYIDNQATIFIAQSHGLIRKVKHLEIHDLFVRFQVANNNIKVHYVPTEKNCADVFTKGIKNVPLFTNLRDLIMAGKRGRDSARDH
jgi:Reverse transcriptase (RNA-dependent DNA polymerase)